MSITAASSVWRVLWILPILMSVVFHTVIAQSSLMHCHCNLNRDRSTATDVSCSKLKREVGRVQCNKANVRDIPAGYHYVPPWGLFKLYRTHLDRDAAKAVCELHGGRLAVPQDAAAAAVLGKLVKDEPGVDVAFVGIDDVGREGNFFATDGGSAPYLVWRNKEPRHGSGDDTCVAMTDDGRLDGLKCEVRAPFLCERRQYTPVPSGFQYVDGAEAFLRLYTKEKVAYSNADKVCQAAGGALAVPDTWRRAEAMLQLVPPGTGYVFVGLTDEQSEGDFVTNDNNRHLSNMEFDVWGPGQPDNGDGYGYEDCLALHPNGTLHDVSCDQEHAFLCEIEAP